MLRSNGFSSIGLANSRIHGTQLVTEAVAVEVAEHFLIHGVRAVELYGSVARNGVGNDLDLILVVYEENTYQDFIAKTKTHVEYEGASRGALCRIRAASQVLFQFHRSCLNIELGEIHPGITEILDVYLMPIDWRDRIDEIQSHLPHSDPCFVKNIAEDARMIADRTEMPCFRYLPSGMIVDP